MRMLTIITCLLCSTLNYALTLKPHAPDTYVVKRGDTLWGIAHHYLVHPWEWKELIRANPQIKNPKRLYPGAILSLRYHNKTPYLQVLSNGTVKLSPRMHETGNEEAIPPIPLSDIKPFLNESIVFDKDVLYNAPYVVAYSGERLLAGQGDTVYVRFLHPQPLPPDGITYSYAIFRPSVPYIHIGTKELLGYKATLVGYGILAKGQEPAALLLTSIHDGVKIKDRVLPNNTTEFSLCFEPTAPINPINATIIDMPERHTQDAVGGVIVIDQGENIGLHAGDVVGIYGKARLVPDPLKSGKLVKIPKERLGEAMVFRSFSKTSFALIVRATSTIHLLDTVSNP